MRSKAVESWDASNSQALPVFDVGVAFVDESALLSKPRREVELAIADIKSIVSSILPSDKAMHITPLEDVFSSESNGREGRLRELVGMINDDTGREDLLQCLRMLSLQKVVFHRCLCMLPMRIVIQFTPSWLMLLFDD
jgi:cytoplasmic tRNA 2-thiolation protein 2